jgi:hypothetical protein
MTKQILNISEKQEVNNYPYGRLKATAFFSIEFDYKKGFRSVFQTINPKTNRLNAEKKSTYSAFMCQFKEDETGHIKTATSNLSSYEDVNKLFDFITKNQDKLQLTEKMIESLCLAAIACTKINARYTPCNTESLLKVLDTPVKTLVSIVKKEEGFSTADVVIDIFKIEELKEQFKNSKNAVASN